MRSGTATADDAPADSRLEEKVMMKDLMKKRRNGTQE